MWPVPLVKAKRGRHDPRHVREDIVFIKSSLVHNMYTAHWVPFSPKPLNGILEFRPKRKSTIIKYRHIAIAIYDLYFFSPNTLSPDPNPYTQKN